MRRSLRAECLVSAAALLNRATFFGCRCRSFDSLADVGNAWAWKTPQVREHAGDEAEVRRTAAAALVAVFLRSQGSLRDAASNGLMAADAPGTPSLIAAAQVGSP